MSVLAGLALAGWAVWLAKQAWEALREGPAFMRAMVEGYEHDQRVAVVRQARRDLVRAVNARGGFYEADLTNVRRLDEFYDELLLARPGRVQVEA